MKNIKAIAFDIDGTLYPDWHLYIRIIPFFLKNITFFLSYNKCRKVLHRTAPLPDFFEYQARLLAEEMKITVPAAHQLIQDKIYEGLKPYFKKIKPYPHIREVFDSLKVAGFKLAILSDFPPEQKGDIWGVAPKCDVILGSESCGALKPSVYPFGIMAQQLGVQNHEILYVGNSIRSDIRGARNAGMKTAYIMPLWRRILRRPLAEADISFENYRKLLKIVLN